jgi:hypothetical protein
VPIAIDFHGLLPEVEGVAIAQDSKGSPTSRPEAGTESVYVGIGASAGALGVLERFFSRMSPDSGLVFVVIQHLDRHYPSVLAELLGSSEAAVRPPLEFPLAGRSTHKPPASRTGDDSDSDAVSTQEFSHAFERMLLEEYAPPSAVTNERGDILYLAGRTGRYLQVAAGVPTNNIFDLAHGMLRVEMRNTLAKAAASKRKVVRKDLLIDFDGGPERLRLTARPLPGVDPDSGLFAVVLQNTGAEDATDGATDMNVGAEQPLIEQLENELHTTRASLQSAMQDLEWTAIPPVSRRLSVT